MRAAVLIVFLLTLPPFQGIALSENSVKDYVACGCGCCGGIDDSGLSVECVKNEAALQAVIQQDQALRKSPNCAVMGCSRGQKYSLCKQPQGGAAIDSYPVLKRGINLSNWLANAERQPLYERDFRQIKAAGFDNVRLPVKPELLAGDFSAVDKAIAFAFAHNLNVVLDLHPREPYMRDMENDKEARQRFITLWVNTAKHYKNYPAGRLVFELLNEPQYYHHEENYNALVRETAERVRETDPERFIIIGAPDGSSLSGLQKLATLQGEKIIYAFHFYEPYMITHQGVHKGFEKKMLRYFHDVPYPSAMVDHNADFYAETAPNPKQAQDELLEYEKAGWDKAHIASRLQRVKEWAYVHHAKVICSEFGVLRNHIDPQSRYRWLTDVRQTLEENGMGWQVWDYSDLDGITKLAGITSTDKVDGSVRLVSPENGNRIIEDEAIKALGLK